MADIIEVEKNKYKINGKLTEEDIKKINEFKNRTTLIMDNTVDLSSELVSKINPERIVFSIKGGLDYDSKEKYKEQKYVDRTMVSPKGLKNIIKYFEYNESLIDPNWNEFEKAMFLYNALVVDMEYADKYEQIQSPGTTERSLNGILYSKLVCAGFAQVYKEMLDRAGIKNYYQNQKDVHAFNVIEVDNKKYGVDVTWDNYQKRNNNGKCSFRRFAHDPNFYERHGHQLYKEVDISDDFENPVLEKVYDNDENIYDLSTLDMNQLNEYYDNISSRINSRKPFRYNLQEQSIDVKNMYLPVDVVDLRLKKEAYQEYPIIIIQDFLKKRNALNVDPQLISAFSTRKGYLLDICSSRELRIDDLNLSMIGINNYKINIDGNIDYKSNDGIKHDHINGVLQGKSDIPQNELNNIYNSLNQYITTYLNKYITNNLNNADNLIESYEYDPKMFDKTRIIENANIYSKLALIKNSKDYLIQQGYNEDRINQLNQRITNKYNETHKTKTINQKENDLEFLSVALSDVNLIRKTIEYDLKRTITDEEFISLFCNADYMIKLYMQYITIGENAKFDMNNFNISKEELQMLLRNIIKNNYNSLNNSESIETEISGRKR